MLKLGSSGEEVRAWGRFLRRHDFISYGAGERFGLGLEKATKRFQDAAGVYADGIVGPITYGAAVAEPYLFVASEQSEGPQTLSEQAGIPPEVLEAVRKVESNGDPSAVRFEPHVFIRIRPDLRGQIGYTPGRGVVWSTVAGETDRNAFEDARKLDQMAAVMATSWGSFQVLGQHLLDEHTGDPEKAVRAFDDDPQGISDKLLVRWFAANPRARTAANMTPPNFEDLARCYNGPHYAKHGYHKRLRGSWLEATRK